MMPLESSPPILPPGAWDRKRQESDTRAIVLRLRFRGPQAGGPGDKGKNVNRGQGTVAGLLAAVAVLLGLNLMARTSPAAVGQYPAAPVQPTVVAGVSFYEGGSAPVFLHRLFRFWSDGTVDTSVVTLIRAENGGGCEPQGGGPPWACGPSTIIPGSCAADVTRNGEVEVNDFLEVLGQWGPCK